MNLFGLIRQSYSIEEARRWRDYRLSAEARETMSEAARDILYLFEPGPGRCTMMTATYVWRLRDMLKAPIFMAVGDLHAGGQRVYGTGQAIDGSALFSENNMSWDGHAWLVLGPWVADVSIFRTAFSPQSPPALADHFRRNFKGSEGLLAAGPQGLTEMGVAYVPRYILTDDEIARLIPRDGEFLNL